jgi:hypothetical protein
MNPTQKINEKKSIIIRESSKAAQESLNGVFPFVKHNSLSK